MVIVKPRSSQDAVETRMRLGMAWSSSSRTLLISFDSKVNPSRNEQLMQNSLHPEAAGLPLSGSRALRETSGGAAAARSFSFNVRLFPTAVTRPSDVYFALVVIRRRHI
jgi:hypothetical protein